MELPTGKPAINRPPETQSIIAISSATRVGGLPDLIDDGRTGVLVTPSDPAALASAIARQLTNQTDSERMRSAARTDVRERFMASRLVADLQRLYLDLLTRKGVTVPPLPGGAEAEANEVVAP